MEHDPPSPPTTGRAPWERLDRLEELGPWDPAIGTSGDLGGWEAGDLIVKGFSFSYSLAGPSIMEFHGYTTEQTLFY